MRATIERTFDEVGRAQLVAAPALADHRRRVIDMADGTCSVEGCEKPVNARGWCHRHYVRWRRNGDPVVSGRKPPKPPRPCEVPDCGKMSSSAGMCSMHYSRWRKYGDVTVVGTNRRPIEDRVNERIDRNGTIVAGHPEMGRCWIWTGQVLHHGYGVLPIQTNGQSVYEMAHRVSYETFMGPIPDGFHIDHVCHTMDELCLGGDSCRHRQCVNPAHLEPVTRAENARRENARLRLPFCKRGHPLSGDNLYLHDGRRHCRACRSERSRNRKARTG